MIRRLAVVLCLLAAACDPKLPDDEIAILVRYGTAEADVGRGFDVTVVRRFSRDLEPDPWTDQALAPLVVRATGTERRADDLHVEETRAFRAYAFEPGSVTVPELSFRAIPKAGGPARVAKCGGFTVRAKTTLDPKAPGPPELPGDPPRPSRRLWVWVAASLAILGAAAMFVRAARKSRGSATPAASTVPSAEERALARVARLRALLPRDREEVRAFHLEMSAALREWLAARARVHALEMTTEELLDSRAVAAALVAPARAQTFDVLGACDLVKFADHASTAEDREGLIAMSEEVLRTGREPAKAGRGDPTASEASGGDGGGPRSPEDPNALGGPEGPA